MNKIGASRHLEMIIAFLMFFIFVTFLLIYIKPYGRGEKTLSDTIIEGLRRDFVLETQTEVIKVFFIAEKDDNDCYNIDLSISNGRSYVESVGDDAYYVYFSDGYSVSAFCPSGVEDTESSIGSVEELSVLSSGKIEELSGINYRDLKTDWNVPDGVDFRIDSVDGDFGVGVEVPGGVDVFAKTYFFEVWSFNENNAKGNKEFIFRVW